jgi:hypothetical protein
MPDTFQPYSDPENLLAIRTIGWNIIHEVAPDEEFSTEKLTERILRAWQDGQWIVAQTDASNAGGFGNMDLILLVIIPVVTAVLDELGKQFGTWNIDALKHRINEKDANKNAVTKLIDLAVEREYKAVNQKVKSKKARPKERIVKRVIKVHLKKLLELES